MASPERSGFVERTGGVVRNVGIILVLGAIAFPAIAGGFLAPGAGAAVGGEIVRREAKPKQ